MDDDKNFMRLARYIGVFGNAENKAQAGVAMTTPVVTDGAAKKGLTPMRFVLPSKYTQASEA